MSNVNNLKQSLSYLNILFLSLVFLTGCSSRSVTQDEKLNEQNHENQVVEKFLDYDCDSFNQYQQAMIDRELLNNLPRLRSCGSKQGWLPDDIIPEIYAEFSIRKQKGESRRRNKAWFKTFNVEITGTDFLHNETIDCIKETLSGMRFLLNDEVDVTLKLNRFLGIGSTKSLISSYQRRLENLTSDMNILSMFNHQLNVSDVSINLRSKKTDLDSLVFTVYNKSKHTIKTIDIGLTILGKNRKVPYYDNNFSIKISGGMESGERHEITMAIDLVNSLNNVNLAEVNSNVVIDSIKVWPDMVYNRPAESSNDIEQVVSRINEKLDELTKKGFNTDLDPYSLLPTSKYCINKKK
jgi:hypothetical protein